MYVYILTGICVINGIILDEIIFITSRLEYQEVTFKPSRIELSLYISLMVIRKELFLGKFQYLGNPTSKFFQFSLFDYIHFILSITKRVEGYPNLINLDTSIQGKRNNKKKHHMLWVFCEELHVVSLYITTMNYHILMSHSYLKELPLQNNLKFK